MAKKGQEDMNPLLQQMAEQQPIHGIFSIADQWLTTN